MSSMCLRKCCLLHTAAKYRASYIFWQVHICSFFPICCTRLLRLERQGLREEILILSNVSLVSLSVLFHQTHVSKIAVYRTRQLKDLASVYFLGGYMFFFYNLPHTAGKAQASRLQQRKTCIIKCFSRVPKHPISFSMCIKNSSLLHTAAEDRASVYFLGGIRSFFTVSRTRLLRLERQMIF